MILQSIHKTMAIFSVWLLLGLLLVAGKAPAQQSASEIRKQLETIKREIDRLQKELQAAEKQLQSEIAIAQNLDKQIHLVNQALRLLNKEISRNQKRIGDLERQIRQVKHQLQTLTRLFEKQIVFAYKYQRGLEYSWLLGSQNFHQAYVRLRYFRRVSQSARNVYNRLVDKQKELERLQGRLTAELAEKERLAKEKAGEQAALKEKLAERRRMIQTIRNNRSLLARTLKQKRQNYERLKKLIAELEQKRATRKLHPQTQQKWERISGSFARQKGKLNWPVRGKILHPFGRYKNPQLKTVLFNTGIDIRAPKGAPVRCVFPGVVTMITYLSGFGNTVIVDHNDGYYTVYAHLDDIQVTKFQFLEAGDVIGTVGESGSLEGPLLHFEIYGGKKPLNPQKWLKR
ncbi:MAG: peptidoglycan DD-metalloendopeptidase family protein [Calditrichaeota bacterium]|nr:peptidoglycan DD-metalloendopeptidase family protein [Calditrichota bacterium]